MIDDEIEHHANVLQVRGVDEVLQVLNLTVGRINCVVIGRVVAVRIHRLENGHQPNSLHAEIGKIIHP
ncbi:MAG: hypothetical protein BWY39_01521 [Spirochaetes bacterium ADurb.Bin269]|nr:MAG: hypothetical protein BWY39_01521 [Spirochaetes bacterium ADurb.Bin269]